MAATMIVNEKNGAAETATDKTSGVVRFKNADDAVVDLNNPMVIPATGSDWSFEKWLRLNVSGIFTQISNLKFYTDGTSGFGTGVNTWAKSSATYTTPAELTSSTGYLDAFGYTSAAPLDIGVGPYTVAGDIGSYVVLGLEVQSTASQGTLASETITFSYDEI